MNKKGLNLWLLLTLLLVSTACIGQKGLATGRVNNTADNPAEDLEVKLHLNREIKPNRQYKRTEVQADETFQMKEKPNRSCVLETSADKMPERGLCAHRGAMETHPENTIPAFREAVKAGAHMIEFDVQLTKDKKLVVMHDATVDRTTNGTGNVSALTLEEIKQLDSGSWKSPEFKGLQVPTFREVLDEMPVNVWLNIHLKGTGDAPKMIAEMLAEENRLHQAFLACGAEAAKQARSVVPEIQICNMDRRESNWDYVSGTIEMEAGFIQLRGSITLEFAEHAKTLKENGVRINYYGTDSPKEIKMLYDYGIDFPLVNDIISTMSVAEEVGFFPVKPVFR